jgi:hypothetical protein
VHENSQEKEDGDRQEKRGRILDPNKERDAIREILPDGRHQDCPANEQPKNRVLDL